MFLTISDQPSQSKSKLDNLQLILNVIFMMFWVKDPQLKMYFKLVWYQMSHCYLCSKSKTNMKKWYFGDFRAIYFLALNKKDPVLLFKRTHLGTLSTYVVIKNFKYKNVFLLFILVLYGPWRSTRSTSGDSQKHYCPLKSIEYYAKFGTNNKLSL